MSSVLSAAPAGVVCIAIGVVLLRRNSQSDAIHRLLSLHLNSAEKNRTYDSEYPWLTETGILRRLGDRFGKAGLYSTGERHAMLLLLLCLGFAGGALGLFVSSGSSLQVLLTCGSGLYFGVLVWFWYLRRRMREFEREVLFHLPLVLESLILLVESGLGILPAIERLVGRTHNNGAATPVHRLLRVVYELSAHGMPLKQALATVAEVVPIRVFRHVLLHLDISGSEGGELIPSLRSLSNHAHREWTHSVETRVRRLENLVVFPVFASVLGLMLLTVAAPIVPILEFQEKIETKQSVSKVLGAAHVR